MYASKHRGRRDGVGSSWSRSSGSFGGSEPASLDGPPWQRVHPEPMEPSRRDRESAMTMPFGKNTDPKGIAGTATRTREAKTTTLREKKLPSKEPPRPQMLQGREISTRREELRRTRRVAMVLVLCIGDFHVPYRSSGMPKKFLVRRRWTRREGRIDRWRPGADRRETDAGHARTRKDTNCALHGKPVHKIHATLSQKHCTGRARGAGRLRPGGGISRREGTLRRRKVRRS